ncbi:MAG: hypothetical protein AAB116_14740, partial [Candidatus Poribacteria bacterium]
PPLKTLNLSQQKLICRGSFGGAISGGLMMYGLAIYLQSFSSFASSSSHSMPSRVSMTHHRSPRQSLQLFLLAG